MSVAGYKTHFLGGVRTGYLMQQIDVDATRDTPSANVQEFPVNRVVAGPWSASLGGQVFGSTLSEALLAGYVKAATDDVPFVGVEGTALADTSHIVLCNAFGPIGNAGVDGDRLTRAPLTARMSSREPLYGGKTIYYADTSTGLTASLNPLGVNLGAIPAGSEGIFVFVNPHWPSLGGTAIGTYTLEHAAVGSTATIDAGPAVDKGGGLVGIPATGHGFVSGQSIRFIGTTSYSAAVYVLDATTSVNEMVIPETFVAETFAGTETADDLWDSPTTAVETTGTNPWTPTAGTPGYMVVTIDGDTTAVTDTWWRSTFSAITATIYPVVVGGIVTKSW